MHGGRGYLGSCSVREGLFWGRRLKKVFNLLEKKVHHPDKILATPICSCSINMPS